jgi:hypothetical protein
MDLAHDMKKAETHFLAVVVRKKAKFASLRASFDLVDATVLPLSLLEEKFQHCGDASTGLPRSPLDQVREDKEGGLRDGALGNVLAMSFVLDAGEEKTIEQTVKEVRPLRAASKKSYTDTRSSEICVYSPAARVA